MMFILWVCVGVCDMNFVKFRNIEKQCTHEIPMLKLVCVLIFAL